MKRLLSLTEQILIGVALGIIFGVIFGERMLALSFIGDMFIALLKMMVIPLVFFAIASAVLMWEDLSKIGKFAGEAVGFYILTTAVAIFGASYEQIS